MNASIMWHMLACCGRVQEGVSSSSADATAGEVPPLDRNAEVMEHLGSYAPR